ncbi:hypothetical protein ACFX2T_05160 [Gilliamella apicola]
MVILRQVYLVNTKKLRAFCIGIEISLIFCWQNMTKVMITNKPITIKQMRI